MISVILAKYWKHLIAAGLVLSSLLFCYLKGYSDANRYWQVRAAKELESRYAQWEETRKHNDTIVNKIHKRRQSQQDDLYDSCLLSGNPMEDKCQ